MPFTTSPNMGLLVPSIGVEIGPNWAQDINSSLALIDQHQHSPGNGVAISPDGMNINADLPFNDFNLSLVRSVNFSVQGSPLALPGDLGCLYVSGVDLYYNDENGNQIRMTASGGVAGTPGSIGSLTAPASVTYVSATPAFVFQSDVNTSADLDGGSLTIRENVAGAKGIKLSSPVSLANDYTLTLPGALPASGTKFLQVSNTGIISDSLGIDGTTIIISSNNLSVGTITDTNIADNSINGAKLQDGTVVAGTKLAADPTFPGSNFGSVSSGGRIYGVGNTHSLSSGLSDSLLAAYGGSSAKGYRVLSGYVNGGTGAFFTGGEGCTVSRSSAGVYSILRTIAGTGNVIGNVTISAGSAGRLSCEIGTNNNGIAVNIYQVTSTNVVLNPPTPVDSNFHFIMIIDVV